MEIRSQTTECFICQCRSASFFCQKNNHSLYRCQKCGLIFVSPIIMHTEEVYSSDYFAGAKNGFGYVNYDEDKEPMREVFKIYLKHIAKFVPQGKLIDMGAATGYFMKLAREQGWDVSGIEISPFAVEVGKKQGLDLRVGMISDISKFQKVFDVVTLWDVIEHVTDPENDIKILYENVRPGGILAINTPDSSSLMARISRKHWHQLIPPEHVFYFNPRSLTILLERNGFEVVYTGKIGKFFTLQYIIKTAAQWLGLKAGKRLSERLKDTKIGNIKLPLNLRDNFFMLARRRS